jgi:tungstate transport system ATP-binding protein
LTVGQSEVLGLVGPNGSGKTTLLKVMGLVLAPERGWVRYDDLEVVPSRDQARLVRERRRVAMVYQDPILLHRTVYDNVALGLRFRGLSEGQIRPRVSLWLKRLGIGELAGRTTRGLSGGESQRVALARALALEPELLLLDEPTANLDLPARSQLMLDLRSILREIRGSAVLVTHEVQDAPYFADRLLIMRNGRIAQSGPPSDVLSHPCDEEAALFLGLENLIPLELLGGAVAPGGAGETRARIGVRVDQVDIVPLSHTAGAHGPGSARVSLEPPPVGTAVSDGWCELSGTVVQMAPWGPFFRVALHVPGARDNRLTGLCAREHVLRGEIEEGMVARARFDLQAAARL